MSDTTANLYAVGLPLTSLCHSVPQPLVSKKCDYVNEKAARHRSPLKVAIQGMPRWLSG